MVSKSFVINGPKSITVVPIKHIVTGAFKEEESGLYTGTFFLDSGATVSWDSMERGAVDDIVKGIEEFCKKEKI